MNENFKIQELKRNERRDSDHFLMLANLFLLRRFNKKRREMSFRYSGGCSNHSFVGENKSSNLDKEPNAKDFLGSAKLN